MFTHMFHPIQKRSTAVERNASYSTVNDKVSKAYVPCTIENHTIYHIRTIYVPYTYHTMYDRVYHRAYDRALWYGYSVPCTLYHVR